MHANHYVEYGSCGVPTLCHERPYPAIHVADVDTHPLARLRGDDAKLRVPGRSGQHSPTTTSGLFCIEYADPSDVLGPAHTLDCTDIAECAVT